MDADEKMIEEYKETNALHRHQGSIMFAQLTVFLVASSTIFTLPAPSIKRSLVFPLVGLVLSIYFLILHKRLADFSHSFVKHAKELELKLGFSAHLNSPNDKPSRFTAITSTKYLYCLSILFWAFLFLWRLIIFLKT